MDDKDNSPTVDSLSNFLSIFDNERVGKKDFVAAFKKVTEHVKKTQNLTVQHLTSITEAVNSAVSRLAEGNHGQIIALRDQLVSQINEQKQNLDTSHADSLSRLEAAIANVKDGKDADEDTIVDKVLAKIPSPVPAPIGEDYRNALESLKDDDRLDKSAIRGFDELEKKVHTQSTNVIGNNPGVQLDAGSGILGRFQTLKFPGATITTSNVDASIVLPGGTGSGTVTSVSVVSANGFAGTVATPTTTPAITLTTTITGLLKGAANALVQAVVGTDYAPGTSGNATGIVKSTTGTGALTTAVAADFPTLNQNTTGNAATVTTNANLTGPITSSGNATSIASQTGTGSTFAMSASPTFTGTVTESAVQAPTNNSINIASGTYGNIQTYTPTVGGTATLDLSKGNIHHVTMPAGNITIALSNGTAGQCILIRVLQDGTGSRTVTWFTTIRWAGGTVPTLTTTASKADSLGFEITGTNTYDGYVVGANI